MLAQAQPELCSTTRVLTTGGDKRIVPLANGLNKYGFSTTPDASILAYGSSTGSTISQASYDRVESLRCRLEKELLTEKPEKLYERELTRIRQEILSLCGLHKDKSVDVIFAPSGTDIHLIAAQIAYREESKKPLMVIVIDGVETGSGVPAALSGSHFSDCAPFSKHVASGVPIDEQRPVNLVSIKCREKDGSPRDMSLVDAEVETFVNQAVEVGQNVLLTLTDISKTGLIIPSPLCALALRKKFPENVDILVDACQFRLSSATLHAYLERGFLVAITGSKFVTGPTFSGVLFVPEAAAERMRQRLVPSSLADYSARADWPEGWSARDTLPDIANFGLLLRWEAALEEMRRFFSLPEEKISSFLEEFSYAARHHLSENPTLKALPTPAPHRFLSEDDKWDSIPTIFPFLLCRQNGEILSFEETTKVYELLKENLSKNPQYSFSETLRELMSKKCHVGQPVICGEQNGHSLAALRLCVSARIVSEALMHQGGEKKNVIAESLSVLDKASYIVQLGLV